MADGHQHPDEHEQAHERAKFHAMVDGTPQDWAIIANASMEFGRDLPWRLISHLKLLQGDCGGFAIDRLDHSLQTATRAFQDGRDEEYVVCALLHDIGDILGPRNHADIAAAILQPFVSEENHWMVATTPSSRATTSSTTWAWTATCATSSGPSQLRIHRPVLPHLRPGGLRPGLQVDAAGGVRADAAPGDVGPKAVDLPAQGRAAA
jgi:hypothetical protein